MEKKAELQIDGMSCSHCVHAVSNILNADGIVKNSVSLENKSATLIYKDEKISIQEIIDLVNHSGIYTVVGTK